MKLKRKDYLNCKHIWIHKINVAETLDGDRVLGLFHVCKKCNLTTNGEIIQ